MLGDLSNGPLINGLMDKLINGGMGGGMEKEMRVGMEMKLVGYTM